MHSNNSPIVYNVSAFLAKAFQIKNFREESYFFFKCQSIDYWFYQQPSTSINEAYVSCLNLYLSDFLLTWKFYSVDYADFQNELGQPSKRTLTVFPKYLLNDCYFIMGHRGSLFAKF